MAEYFYKRGLKEIEILSVITNLSKERLGLGEMTEEYKNQVILVNLLENADSI